MKTKLLLALSAVALVAGAMPAQARDHHRHWHRHHDRDAIVYRNYPYYGYSRPVVRERTIVRPRIPFVRPPVIVVRP